MLQVCRLVFFQAEDDIRDYKVTGVQTCALPISRFTSRAGSMWVSRWNLTLRRRWRRSMAWTPSLSAAVFSVEYSSRLRTRPAPDCNDPRAPIVAVNLAQSLQHELALFGKIRRHLHKVPAAMRVTVGQQDLDLDSCGIFRDAVLSILATIAQQERLP